MITITITHTPTAGTLLDGTSKSDGTNLLLKPPGLALVREKLCAAGHPITVTIDTGHRNPELVEADRADRQQGLADASPTRPPGGPAAARAADDKARRRGDQIPFGQPILVCA